MGSLPRRPPEAEEDAEAADAAAAEDEDGAPTPAPEEEAGTPPFSRITSSTRSFFSARIQNILF